MSKSEAYDIINRENARQEENIELIASENFPSLNVRLACASTLTAKYCEGYPEEESIRKFKEKYPDYVHTGKVGRYYGGCYAADEMELYCRYMWQKVFNTNYHVNVQPHSGSQANMEAYSAVLNPGDKILAMSLDAGGHLTHSSPVSFVSKIYNVDTYGLNDDGYLNYSELADKIRDFEPKLVVVGASAYSRIIDFEFIRQILAQCDTPPLLMVDMAHIAGLIAAEEHPSPFGIADIITTTTHKTLRGPRGGLIFCKPELATAVDNAVFPRNQGGPLMNIIAAKAVAAEECLTGQYKDYIHQVILNCHAMANKFRELGYHIVSGGTDNHLLLLDLSNTGVNGAQLQEECDKYNITLNKNAIPNDPLPPSLTSGVRIGTAPMTTKGYKEGEFIQIAIAIDTIIKRCGAYK